MFFESVNDIKRIAEKCGTAVFVLPRKVEFDIKNAIILQPENKSVITIEQVKELLGRLKTKHTTDQFVIIRPAELLNIEASNALLKSLEEPGDKVHFILVTDQPFRLLPTIMSRALVYRLKDSSQNKTAILADDVTKVLAKKILAAKGVELVTIIEEITKKKDNVRERCLDVLATAIEMAYKAYFITKNTTFLKRIPKLVLAYDNISMNGNIKLQFLANLI